MARRPSRKELREVIERSGGIVSAVANRYDVSRQTIYNWLDRYGLYGEIRDARESIIDLAEGNVFRAVRGGDLDMSKFVLTRLGRGRGWGNSVEVTGNMVELSPDVVAIMEQMGTDAQTAVRQFEEIIRAQVAQDEE